METDTGLRRITISFEPELFSRIAARAHANGISLAEQVRALTWAALAQPRLRGSTLAVRMDKLSTDIRTLCADLRALDHSG